MKTLYLECNMGAAGDMLMAALSELLPNREEFIAKMNSLGLPGVRVSVEPSLKCGIRGSHISVTVDGKEEESVDVAPDGCVHHEHEHGHDGDHEHEHVHHHAGLAEIEHTIGGLAVSDKVKADVLAVYRLIAEAESHVHGEPVADIYFHEIGTMDAIADIVGVCLLVEELAPDQILCSPVNVGSGHVRCAHGILPVPAPAASYILRDVPIYSGSVRGELCTPTGAALLRHFTTRFGSMPVMRVSATGYGMGKKDFEAANCLRAHIGYTSEATEEVAELSCNLDDMTPEAIGFAQEILFAAGALDVYTTPIGMKKSRPGVLLTCMCRREKTDEMAALIFRHTTTLGLRETICRRYTLRRKGSVIETPYGSIRIKTAYGDGFSKSKPEYEDVAKAAKENGVSLLEIMQNIKI
jgi:uncharacterized protein (TIGR00299 family) protein